MHSDKRYFFLEPIPVLQKEKECIQETATHKLSLFPAIFVKVHRSIISQEEFNCPFFGFRDLLTHQTNVFPAWLLTLFAGGLRNRFIVA